jgi:hypothetical protein
MFCEHCERQCCTASALERIADALEVHNALLSSSLGVDAPGPRCPHCGNTDEATIEDTSVMGDSGRRTCKAPGCGQSWKEERRG